MEPDWLKRRAEAFMADRDGCSNDPWTNKRDCPHCLAALLEQTIAETFASESRADG